MPVNFEGYYQYPQNPFIKGILHPFSPPEGYTKLNAKIIIVIEIGAERMKILTNIYIIKDCEELKIFNFFEVGLKNTTFFCYEKEYFNFGYFIRYVLIIIRIIIINNVKYYLLSLGI